MRRTKSAIAGAVALVVSFVLAGCVPTPGQAASKAVDWLATQQQPDGGFEVAGFPGFETPDAVLAIAEDAQTGTTWNTAEARAAVEAVTTGGGKDALDYLDDFADGGLAAQQAAKIVALVAAPLGIPATDFDPSNDSSGAVNLRATMQPAVDGSDPNVAFNGRLVAAIGVAVLGEPVPGPLVSAIRAAQQANGSWNFAGDPNGTDVDPDTTGLAIQALVAAGVAGSDGDVRAGLRALALSHGDDGSWASQFDDGNPNSTAYAILGVTAAGGVVGNDCWREAAVVELAGVPYTSPLTYLTGQQQSDGRIASPNDAFGVNTFATSQAVQGLLRRWLPPRRAAALACPQVSSNRRFVHAAYRDLLGRLGDGAGIDRLVARLDGGADRSSVAAELSGTSEYRRHLVDDLYLAYLGRPAAENERIFFDVVIRDGRRLDVDSFILGSDEYREKAGGTDEGFVDAVFGDVLGRPPSADERAAFLDHLRRGGTRNQLARLLLSGSEGRSVQVKRLFLTYLRRSAKPDEITFWRDRLQSGIREETVINSLLGSTEYLALTRP